MMDPISEASWLPLAEAVPALGKAERTIRLWIDAGRIEGRKVEAGGRLVWEVRVQGGEPVPPETPVARRQTPVDPISDPAEGTVVLHRELATGDWRLAAVHLELIRRHEKLSGQIGFLQAQVQQLPMLEEGREMQEARVAELEAARLAAERAVAAARVSEARERWRARVAVILCALLAVLSGMLSGMLLVKPRSSPGIAPPGLSSNARPQSMRVPGLPNHPARS